MYNIIVKFAPNVKENEKEETTLFFDSTGNCNFDLLYPNLQKSFWN